MYGCICSAKVNDNDGSVGAHNYRLLFDLSAVDCVR